MTARGRNEVLFGLGSGAFGLLLLLLAYLQPYAESGSKSTPTDTNQYVSYLHPGFTSTELPYIIAIGAPILCVVIGATVHGLVRSADSFPMRLVAASAQLLLWVATGVLLIETVIGGIADLLGVLLVPSLIMGLCASVLAFKGRQGSGPTRHIMRSVAM